MTNNQGQVAVVDLFAGPGGLGEGFAMFRNEQGEKPFRVVLSVEKARSAHQTLRLRSFFRQFEEEQVPEEYYQILRGERTAESLQDSNWQRQWERADREVLRAELGSKADQEKVERVLTRETPSDESAILIGGPPCQAYSLAGRSRLGGDPDYEPENDERHELYKEYLKIVSKVRPAAFIMENVKGILSSSLKGERIFQRILEDLSNPARALNLRGRHGVPRYEIFPVISSPDVLELFAEKKPASFVIRCEKLGAPQRRHRVILLGLQEGLVKEPEGLTEIEPAPSIADIIGSMPAIRSELSQRSGDDSWHAVFNGGVSRDLLAEVASAAGDSVAKEMKNTAKRLAQSTRSAGGEFVKGDLDLDSDSDLKIWLRDERIGGYCNHRSRGHMADDLLRYLYAACYARSHGDSPNLKDFPGSLLPDHQNVQTAVRWNSYFADRFRVQLKDRPATTITSHISKDGHYYIHFDPEQCRSLTVREAARLQTFPDNYFFCGPRTAQYVQVGNAVPPWVARKIAGVVYQTLKNAGVI